MEKSPNCQKCHIEDVLNQHSKTLLRLENKLSLTKSKILNFHEEIYNCQEDFLEKMQTIFHGIDEFENSFKSIDKLLVKAKKELSNFCKNDVDSVNPSFNNCNQKGLCNCFGNNKPHFFNPPNHSDE